MRRLPPLSALRVFEVAARTGSYADAAAQLGVTHGAVSRQIALLERWLGQRLFAKDGRRMVATPMARIFAAEVGLAFDRVAIAAEACGRPGARRVLRVSATTSFAMRWLIPRLARYRAANPDVDVALTTVSTALDQLRGGFDVAIRRGVAREDAWPGHRVVAVLDDVDTLIASPALLARTPIREAADVADHAFLATETRAGDWADWLAAAGLHDLAGRPRRIYDHFYVTRQAVADGLGLGIGPLPMLAIDVAAGTLATPLPHVRVPRTGYVAIYPREAAAGNPSAAFTAWLAAEAHEPPGATTP